MKNARWIGTLTLLMALGAPSSSEAAMRLGANLQVPALTVDVGEGTLADASPNWPSLGGNVYGLMGLDIFAFGLKVNLTRLAYEDAGLDHTQSDLNAMLRVGLPATDLAFWAESGLSFAAPFDGVGYNYGVGAMYDVLGLPLLDLNVGAGLQYVTTPVGSDAYGSLKADYWRALLTLGVDFSI